MRKVMLQSNDIYRKTFHIGNMIFPLSYWFVINDKLTMIFLLGSLLAMSIFLDIIRRKDGWIKSFFERYFFFMMKPKEKTGEMTGATWVFLGLFVTSVLFPREIAIPAMLFLSVGDSFAAIIGINFGKIKYWGKSLEGSLAGLTACLIVAVLYPKLPFPVTAIGALTAMIIEALPITIDDNIRIPVFAGIVMYGLVYFGLF